MSYYDDWVEPNAFFRGGSRLGHVGGKGKRTTPKIPKHHAAGGCGVEVRIVDDHEQVTCKRCLRLIQEGNVVSSSLDFETALQHVFGSSADLLCDETVEKLRELHAMAKP